MLTRRIYISGPISGVTDGNAAAFDEAEKLLRKRGFAVFNPTKHCVPPPRWLDHPDLIWQHYMKQCVRVLPDHEVIYMLPHWQNSKGAVWEHRLAEALGLEIRYAPVPDHVSDDAWAISDALRIDEARAE